MEDIKVREEDLDFQDEVFEELICPFHHGILQDPVIGPCGHSFCNTCVTSLLDNEYIECPLCSEPIKLPLYANNVAIAVISRLKVKCHISKDCNVIIPLGELAIHRRKCKKRKNLLLGVTNLRNSYKSPSLSRMVVKVSSISWEIDFSELKLLFRVGVGAYGEVFKATFRGTFVAVKRELVFANNEKERTLQFKQELDFLKSVRHPNVILFIGACLQRNNMCIVMEFMTDGSLRDYLDKVKSTSMEMDWKQMIKWCVDGATGLAYLHGQNIIHRDVKSNNLLLNGNSLKIADLGLARKSDSNKKSQAGNWAWMSPEMLNCDRAYGNKVDVYSFGIVLVEIITGLQAEDIPRTKKMVLDTEGIKEFLPKKYPNGFLSLINACCSLNPDDRPTFTNIIELLNEVKLPSQRRDTAPIPRKSRLSTSEKN